MLELTENNFDQAISGGTILVDFWASWCSPCRVLMPVLEKVSKQFSVAKVDVQAHPSLAKRFEINGIPTLIVFKDGVAIKTLVGLQNESDLIAIMESV